MMNRARHIASRIPALLALASLTALIATPQEPGQARVDAHLREMTTDRLLKLGWESEALDLDYRAAASAYLELARRPNVDALLRLRAYQRLFDIWSPTARFADLSAITGELAQDEMLPERYRKVLAHLHSLLSRFGARAENLFRAARQEFVRSRDRERQRGRSSAERQRLRKQFIERLRDGGRELHELLRFDLRNKRTSLLRGVQQLARRQAVRQRLVKEKELREQLRRVTGRLHELEEQGRTGTREYKRGMQTRRRLETTLRQSIRSRNSSPSDHRRLNDLRNLERRIEEAEDAGQHELAGRLIGRAERLHRQLPRALRRRFWTLRSALESPLARRRTLEVLLQKLDQQRAKLLENGRLEMLRVVEEHARKVRPLLEAKRYKEAAKITLEHARRHRIFNRVFRSR